MSSFSVAEDNSFDAAVGDTVGIKIRDFVKDVLFFIIVVKVITVI